jgi:putative acetyltransferase
MRARCARDALIVEALRVADALEISLVAESGGEVVGHIAFSAAAALPA